MGDWSYNFALLQELFDEHFKKVHMREDASQADTRVVRESTEGQLASRLVRNRKHQLYHPFPIKFCHTRFSPLDSTKQTLSNSAR